MKIIGEQKENGNEEDIFEIRDFYTLKMMCRVLSSHPAGRD
jgi:hypothetical protein